MPRSCLEEREALLSLLKEGEEVMISMEWAAEQEGWAVECLMEVRGWWSAAEKLIHEMEGGRE